MIKTMRIYAEFLARIIAWVGAISFEIATGWENIKHFNSYQFTVVLVIVILATAIIACIDLSRFGIEKCGTKNRWRVYVSTNAGWILEKTKNLW